MTNPKKHHFHALAFLCDSDSDNPEPFFHECFGTIDEAVKIIAFWRDLWDDELYYCVEHYDEKGRLISVV